MDNLGNAVSHVGVQGWVVGVGLGVGMGLWVLCFLKEFPSCLVTLVFKCKTVLLFLVALNPEKSRSESVENI